MLIGLTLLLFSSQAEAFRCGSKLVREGLTELEVTALCGEPTERRDLGLRLLPYVSRDGARRNHDLNGRFIEEVRVTALTYDLGPRRLIRRLIFHNAILVQIETLRYGSDRNQANFTSRDVCTDTRWRER